MAGKGESFLYGDVAAGRLLMAQMVTPHPFTYGQHLFDSGD